MPAMGEVEESEHVGPEARPRGRGLEVGDDGRDVALAVAALHDLAGALVELDHALRIQQDEARLRRLPLQAKAVADAGDGGRRQACGVRAGAHDTPYCCAIASFM